MRSSSVATTLVNMMRQMLGGSPDATEADPDAAARFFAQSAEMQGAFELMKADEDSGQGKDHWKEYLRLVFHRMTRPPGYNMSDLHAITAPTLILVGDRDEFCSVEEGVRAYRALPQGELAVVPNTGHIITPPLVELMAGTGCPSTPTHPPTRSCSHTPRRRCGTWSTSAAATRRR